MKTLFAILIALLSQTALSQHSHQHHADPAAVHGMLLFGSEKIYLSHLPMFHSPHDYQVLFEVELPSDIKAVYQGHMAQDAEETVYTLVPQKFVLPTMALTPVPFKAVLYKGHFERGGKAITRAFEVNISEVLHFKKFVPADPKPERAQYLLIGNKAEKFLIHVITSKPDFDHINSVEIEDNFTQDLKLGSKALPVSFAASNALPLPVGKKLSARLPQRQVEVVIKKQLYLEYDDLAQ